MVTRGKRVNFSRISNPNERDLDAFDKEVGIRRHAAVKAIGGLNLSRGGVGGFAPL